MNVEGLRADLAAEGIAAEVEARERLAVIVASTERDADVVGSRRATVLALAAANGFSHVALEVGAAARELTSVRGDAPLPRD